MVVHTTESFQLENGLTILLEPMPDVQSAAFSLMVPSGAVRDPGDRRGTAAVLAEMLHRGTQRLDSRELTTQLDCLGLQRSINVGSQFITLCGATISDKLNESLRLISEMILKPRLAEDEFPAARELIGQTLSSMMDEPRQRMGVALRRCSFASPWGEPSDGDLDQLGNIEYADVVSHWKNFAAPNESILGVAGDVDSRQVMQLAEELFGDWKPNDAPAIPAGGRQPSPLHMDDDSTQTQIGLSWRSVPYQDPNYFEAWAAIGLLSGGMSSRLFTEVREKRGLCYSINASQSTLRDEARVMCYAGTTSERAQETLDVTMHEIRRLNEDITENELERCRARAKSSLIMQQESTFSRASSIARDWYHLGRIITLTEIHERINHVSVESVGQFLDEHPVDDLVCVTLGPEPLSVPS